MATEPQIIALLSDEEIKRRLAIAGLKEGDFTRLAAVNDLVSRQADRLTAVFFDFLKGMPEASMLFRRADLLAEATQLKRNHMLGLAAGAYGRQYCEERLRLGGLYARAGLDAKVFLAAFHHLVGELGGIIMKQSGLEPDQAFDTVMSLNKVEFLDIGLILDTLIAERERVITAQQDAIRELSTPVLQLRDRLLILPIIGVLDSARAKQLADSLLNAIREKRAKVVVMDITGVSAVDSKVANHLIQTVAAARLMGAHAIVTGLSAEVAQSLVALGVDLSTLNTAGDLQGGLELADLRLSESQPARRSATPLPAT